ncbi:MAG: flagellar hook-associated protein FlgL [Nitrospinae bacterium]|nr:flagellar hook-associated protein FlgL [Nitrospinota bacterium]
MMRVTNAMIYNNAVFNLELQTQSLLDVNNQVSSGKRVNSPADDPVAIGQILNLQASNGAMTKYAALGRQANASLSMADGALSSLSSLVVSAQSLMVQAASSATNNPSSLAAAAQTVDNMIGQAIQVGNAKIGDQYIFGGTATSAPPINQNGLFTGNATEINIDINAGASIQSNIFGSDFLAANLNPALDAGAANPTPLSALRGGAGIGATPAQFTITDRAGAATAVNVAAGGDLNAVISAINGGAANVTASVSKDGRSIKIVDNNGTNASGPLTITDVVGTAAAGLGIAGSRNAASFSGDSLNPAVTADTALGDLLGGAGLTPGNITVANGNASNTVSFAGAKTVGDLINAINASPGLNATAAINPVGNALVITSNTPATIAYATDIGTGTTAELLGIGGGRNLITTLQKFSAAMKADDQAALRGMMPNIQSALNAVSFSRGVVGGRINQITSTATQLTNYQAANSVQLSNVQDADMAKVLTQLAQLQLSYQATSQVTAKLLQPGLMSYL